MLDSSSKNSGTKSVTLIARNTSVQGKVNFSGYLNIEGSVIGDIAADEGAKSEVAILEHGVVEGQVQAPRVIVNGRVSGDIYASDQLYIAAKAVVEGSVHYRLIEMEKGAQISGNMVHRSGPSKDSKPSSGITEAMDNGVNKVLANT